MIPSRTLWLTCILFAVVGCRAGHFSTATLPAEWAAPSVVSHRSLDLASLAQSNSNPRLVQPGDVLRVSIVTGLQEAQPSSWSIRVDEEGFAKVPLVGPVRLAGLTLSDADRVVGETSIQRGLYRNPLVSVVLDRRKTHEVTVVGAVENPGIHELPVATSDLLTAIISAGGLSDEATTQVEIRQATASPVRFASLAPGQVPARADNIMTRQIDLATATRSGPLDLRLQDGAMVMVKSLPPRQIYISGLVRKPDQYQMPNDQDLRLLDALAMAGGRRSEMADRIRIVRHLPPNDSPIVIRGSVRAAKRDQRHNIRLAAGDVVSLEETPLTFVDDLLRNFLRFGLTAGVPGI